LFNTLGDFYRWGCSETMRLELLKKNCREISWKRGGVQINQHLNGPHLCSLKSNMIPSKLIYDWEKIILK
jgi:hypothetical protein